MLIYMPKIKIRYYSISEILKIKEYWNLIGREPFLAITSEPDFSQACIFHRMLMNQKNFHFTQIPDKANYVISSKSPKNLFLGHFWPFLVIFARWKFFQENLVLSHITIYGPQHRAKFHKKLISQFWEKLRTDGRTDGKTDGPYFIGPFRLRPGVQETKILKCFAIHKFKNYFLKI